MNNDPPKVTVIPANKVAEKAADTFHQLRVAAYCRVSTAQEEQLNSYQVQIDYYTALINNNKEWRLVGIFADEGISGTQRKNRNEFNRMMKLCKQKKIDLILCKSISRFARNTVDCLECVRELKALNIGVYFEKENINTLKLASEFLISLYSSFAQAESESLSKNIIWGTQKAFAAGKVRYNFKYWLGYKRGSDGKPEIVPREAETVKRIFKMYLDGLSYGDIARILEETKTLTKFGKKNWDKASVRSILINEKYAGDVILQKSYTKDCISHKQVKNNGERPKYLVSDAHKPIIDRETFNQVQQEIARRGSIKPKDDTNKSHQGRYSSKYALTGRMICAECGSPYIRVTWKRGGKRTIVWRCINRFHHGPKYCRNSPSIYEDKLHSAIVKALNEFFICKEDIQMVLESCTDEALFRTRSSMRMKSKQRLYEISRIRDDYIKLIEDGLADETVLSEDLERLAREEKHLMHELNVNSDEALAPRLIDSYDDVLVRKTIECIMVISRTEIQIIFKGGYKLTEYLDK